MDHHNFLRSEKTFLDRVSLYIKKMDIVFSAAVQNKSVNLLFKEEWDCIKGAAPKRQTEFSTARWCAHQSLKKLGIHKQGPILVGENGEPLWPEGVTGSITHADGFFCAVTALKSNYSSLGVDIEPIGRTIDDDVAHLIVNDDEREWLERIDGNVDFMKLLIFSTKESFFKLLSPLIKKRVSFDTGSVFLSSSKQSGSLAFFLKKSVHPKFNKGLVLEGNYFFDKKWLLTLSYIRNEKNEKIDIV